jgi:hypothetical protein
MLAISAPHRASNSLAQIPSRIFAAWRKLLAQAFARPFESRGVRWHSLNERLLRDIGVSPLEADIARLQQRWGVPEGGESNPLDRRLGG